VFYHQAESLRKDGFRVSVFSTMETKNEVKDNINIQSINLSGLSYREKKQRIIEHLCVLTPDLIICDTPVSVLSARGYGKKNNVKIVYDITEWYPSYYHVSRFHGLKKCFYCFIFIVLFLFAGAVSDGFIFGEYYKSKPFRLLYFWKRFVYLSYFPDLKYIETLPSEGIKERIRLFYGGNFSPRRGLDALVQSVVMAARIKTDTVFELHLIGNISNKNEEQYFDELAQRKLLKNHPQRHCEGDSPKQSINSGLLRYARNDEKVQFLELIKDIPSNVEIYQKPLLNFTDFCRYISRMDLCFDLRKKSWEQNHSLPIKLFYYIACGRHVIYSKLKSIISFFADRELLKIYPPRHCEGDSPKQSIDNQFSGLLHFVRNDGNVRFLEVSDISFGYLVEPSACVEIADIIVNYIENPQIYIKHCENALNLSKEKYNWDIIKDDFIKFIKEYF
jgi:glycosyltransferase involved in cell wall biosynthesis